MKKNRNIFIITILLVFAILIYTASSTMAKYRESLKGNITGNIARWQINVNDENINGKNTLTNEIDPVFESSAYVSDGVIAPGSKGYFDIEIDATNTDVDFNYNISIAVSEDSKVQDLIVYAYKINDEEIVTFEEAGNIEGTIEHNTASTTIRVFFKWNDDVDTETMDNEDDTEAGTIVNGKAKFVATINFTQVRNSN